MISPVPKGRSSYVILSLGTSFIHGHNTIYNIQGDSINENQLISHLYLMFATLILIYIKFAFEFTINPIYRNRVNIGLSTFYIGINFHTHHNHTFQK